VSAGDIDRRAESSKIIRDQNRILATFGTCRHPLIKGRQSQGSAPRYAQACIPNTSGNAASPVRILCREMPQVRQAGCVQRTEQTDPSRSGRSDETQPSGVRV